MNVVPRPISALFSLLRRNDVPVLSKLRRIIIENTLLRDNVTKVQRNVRRFLDYAISELRLKEPILDIGPQQNGYSTNLFSRKYEYITLDIDPNSGADIIADICDMPSIPDESFGTIICTEVLEHTLNPFRAAEELHRVLKTDGYLLVSTPFNLRIHHPPPDCWRFTEQGLRVLFGDRFEILRLKALVPLVRRLMPIHYTMILKKTVNQNTNCQSG